MTEEFRKDGYYTAILIDYSKQTFFAQVYSFQGMIYTMPRYYQIPSDSVKEVLTDTWRENL